MAGPNETVPAVLFRRRGSREPCRTCPPAAASWRLYLRFCRRRPRLSAPAGWPSLEVGKLDKTVARRKSTRQGRRLPPQCSCQSATTPALVQRRRAKVPYAPRGTAASDDRRRRAREPRGRCRRRCRCVRCRRTKQTAGPIAMAASLELLPRARDADVNLVVGQVVFRLVLPAQGVRGPGRADRRLGSFPRLAESLGRAGPLLPPGGRRVPSFSSSSCPSRGTTSWPCRSQRLRIRPGTVLAQNRSLRVQDPISAREDV